MVTALRTLLDIKLNLYLPSAVFIAQGQTTSHANANARSGCFTFVRLWSARERLCDFLQVFLK